MNIPRDRDEVAIELARLTREAVQRVRNRIAARQLGEAFADPTTRTEAPAP